MWTLHKHPTPLFGEKMWGQMFVSRSCTLDYDTDHQRRVRLYCSLRHNVSSDFRYIFLTVIVLTSRGRPFYH